jgi:hypothetical protein
VTYLIVTPRTSTRSFRTSGDLSHCHAADQHQELQDLRWLISLSCHSPAPGAPGPLVTHLIVMPQPSPRSSRTSGDSSHSHATSPPSRILFCCFFLSSRFYHTILFVNEQSFCGSLWLRYIGLGLRGTSTVSS